MLYGFTGKPGCGKTYVLTETIEKLLIRNFKFHQKFPELEKRFVYTNVELSEKFIDTWKDYLKFFGQEHDISDLDFIFEVADIDIVFDEIGVYFDSTQWASLELRYRQWFALHEHYGVDIYFASQDFAQIDKSFRRMVETLYWLEKVIGSPRPSATKPKIKHVWGFITGKELNAKSYQEDNIDKSFVDDTLFGMRIWFLKKDVVTKYETTQKFRIVPRPLTHIKRVCKTCGYVSESHK